MNAKTVKERLGVIANTRLLRNSSGELGAYIGFNLSSPSNIYKVGGGNDFLKEAVYHQLCYDVEETFELDLNRLLADYLRVSEELKGRLSGLRRRMANDGLVLENDGDGYVRTLRLLIGLGVLPLASSRKGDVMNIRQDFERVLEMLMQMGERQPKTEYKNVVNSYRDYFYGDEVLETRIGMICAAHRVLEYYDGYRTTRNTYVTSEMLLSRQMFFPLDGFWTEDEGKSSVFWKFEKLENSYHLYRYQVDDGNKVISYRVYLVMFQRLGDMLVMEVLHPEYIEKVLQNKRLTGDEHATYSVTLDDEYRPRQLEFEKNMVEKHWFQPRRLMRMKDEQQIKKRLESERYEKRNEFADYEYTVDYGVLMLSHDSIYLDRKAGGLYRVPKSLDDSLQLVKLDDLAGECFYKGKTFLAFDNQLLYYDVSDEEKLAALGIEVMLDEDEG